MCSSCNFRGGGRAKEEKFYYDGQVVVVVNKIVYLGKELWSPSLGLCMFNAAKRKTKITIGTASSL